MSQPTPYVVNSVSPVKVLASGSVQTVYNSDVVNQVFLSDWPTPLGGFPLNPGSTLQWDSGKDLYLSVVAGVAVTVYVLPNGGQLTDASAIAGAIIAQGLAQDIADKIAIEGAPSIDVPMYTQISSNMAGNTTQVISNVIDSSKYGAIDITIWDERNADFDTLRLCQIRWLSSGSIVALDHFSTYGGFSGQGQAWQMTLPVRGDSFQVIVSCIPSDLTATLADVNFFTTLSYKVLPKSVYNTGLRQGWATDPPAALYYDALMGANGFLFNCAVAGTHYYERPAYTVGSGYIEIQNTVAVPAGVTVTVTIIEETVYGFLVPVRQVVIPASSLANQFTILPFDFTTNAIRIDAVAAGGTINGVQVVLRYPLP